LKTSVIKIDANNIDSDKLSHAAGVLKNGGLVAFPTETVYGLGANALNEKAVEGIFKAKGRPSDNPLIVHISKLDDLKPLVSHVPCMAEILADAFWPGPLTIIMKKSEAVSRIITAGLDTVAVRMPSHPVALELIRLACTPVAAPSANSSGRPSPTRAEHVMEDLSGKVDVIIDSGPVEIGLESTVLDITVNPPVILRPGGITPAQLENRIGPVNLSPAVLGMSEELPSAPKSPGMKYRHYAPKAKITVFEGQPSRVAEEIIRRHQAYAHNGIKTAILATDETLGLYKSGAAALCNVISMGSRNSPETIAGSLFNILRQLDQSGTEQILAEGIPSEGLGLAVMNRLAKAAAYYIIYV
jgi:L-threonylcarbamoyladenylate synthase